MWCIWARISCSIRPVNFTDFQNLDLFAGIPLFNVNKKIKTIFCRTVQRLQLEPRLGRKHKQTVEQRRYKHEEQEIDTWRKDKYNKQAKTKTKQQQKQSKCYNKQQHSEKEKKRFFNFRRRFRKMFFSFFGLLFVAQHSEPDQHEADGLRLDVQRRKVETGEKARTF